jgi:class 3 adenylate cyclase
MKRLTYLSKFTRELSTDEIASIGKRSAERNSREGITGVLLTIGDMFYQVIEGKEAVIDDLFKRISRDDRHTNVVSICTENDVNTRNYPDWGMKIINLDEETGELLGIVKDMLANIAAAHMVVDQYTQPTVSHFLRRGYNPLTLPPRRVEHVAMFADVVGFTNMTRNSEIEDVVELVNAALNICSEVVVQRNGELTKFLGDGCLAYWPVRQTDDAVNAALDCMRRLKYTRSEAETGSLLHSLYMGFGLASGEMIEGNIGSITKMDYTIIGHAVNTAARLEQLSRRLKTPLLLTSQVVEHISGDWDTSSLGKHTIKGLSEPIEVFTIDDPIIADFPL